ncbi:MAG: ATP-dependent Clp protease proteolytic subunit [Oscillospiraceae bacterium]|nr:ATP-dependent Clp protease proteolytic subunit [Oscillospiraceae bacterium]
MTVQNPVSVIMESARGYQPIILTDVLMSQRKIFMLGAVDTESCSRIISQLMYLDSAAPGEDITVYINSPGGNVSDGLGVYDCMRMIRSRIRTVCIGTAASMGSIIFLGGDRRCMLPHSRLMIHDPSNGSDFTGKRPNDIQTALDMLRTVQYELCEIISERTGQKIEDVYEQTATETYFNSQQAVDHGFATEIISSLE